MFVDSPNVTRIPLNNTNQQYSCVPISIFNVYHTYGGKCHMSYVSIYNVHGKLHEKCGYVFEKQYGYHMFEPHWSYQNEEYSATFRFDMSNNVSRTKCGLM